MVLGLTRVWVVKVGLRTSTLSQRRLTRFLREPQTQLAQSRILQMYRHGFYTLHRSQITANPQVKGVVR
jgi:hypothetical protein